MTSDEGKNGQNTACEESTDYISRVENLKKRLEEARESLGEETVEWRNLQGDMSDLLRSAVEPIRDHGQNKLSDWRQEFAYKVSFHDNIYPGLKVVLKRV